jgi:hypothetical protein
LGVKHPNSYRLMNRFAKLYESMNPEHALNTYQRAIDTQKNLRYKIPVTLKESIIMKADFHLKRDEYKKAITLYKEGFSLLKMSVRQHDAALIPILEKMEVTYGHLGLLSDELRIHYQLQDLYRYVKARNPQ